MVINVLALAEAQEGGCAELVGRGPAGEEDDARTQLPMMNVAVPAAGRR